MKIMTVVGARPQFIKAAAVSRAMREDHHEVLVHTGQHYDYEMSRLLFEELEMGDPDFNLEVGSGTHATQTAEIMVRLESLINESRPAIVLVYGDTNSTVAAALTAAKLGIPVAHVESGVRSYRLDVPEEVNRVVTDHVSTMLFCPTRSSLRLLENEGIGDRAIFSGDVMHDILLQSLPLARRQSSILHDHQLKSKSYLLATIHRPRNTDDARNLSQILSALADCGRTVIMPIHPRTMEKMTTFGLLVKYESAGNLRFVPPVGYLDMLVLEENAYKIVTDSGGVQKEAYILGTPCLTCDLKTEWTETVDDGWNLLVGSSRDAILAAIQEFDPRSERLPHFGDGQAARRIVEGLHIGV